MSTNYYNLYCDESGTHAKYGFYLGAICCSPRRAEILESRLNKIRRQYRLSAEMKWEKVSVQMLAAYKAFVDVFLDDPYCSFWLMEIRRGKQWKAFGRNEDERFYKSYYVFFRRNMNLYSRYTIYADDKEGKPHRWNKLRYAVNEATRRDHDLDRTMIRELITVDSHSSDLVQVTDVLLGAAGSSATAPAKAELSRYVSARLDEPRFLGNPKLVRHVWTPQLLEDHDRLRK